MHSLCQIIFHEKCKRKRLRVTFRKQFHKISVLSRVQSVRLFNSVPYQQQPTFTFLFIKKSALIFLFRGLNGKVILKGFIAADSVPTVTPAHELYVCFLSLSLMLGV